MKIKITERDLLALIIKQIGIFFMIDKEEEDLIEKTLPDVLSLTEENFSQADNKYYHKNAIKV